MECERLKEEKEREKFFFRDERECVSKNRREEDAEKRGELPHPTTS